jgi:hypothetical protein
MRIGTIGATLAIALIAPTGAFGHGHKETPGIFKTGAALDNTDVWAFSASDAAGTPTHGIETRDDLTILVSGQKWLYDLTPVTSKIEFPAAADEQRNQFIASFPGERPPPEASSVEPGGSSQAVLGTVPGELWLTETGGLVG